MHMSDVRRKPCNRPPPLKAKILQSKCPPSGWKMPKHLVLKRQKNLGAFGADATFKLYFSLFMPILCILGQIRNILYDFLPNVTSKSHLLPFETIPSYLLLYPHHLHTSPKAMPFHKWPARVQFEKCFRKKIWFSSKSGYENQISVGFWSSKWFLSVYGWWFLTPSKLEEKIEKICQNTHIYRKKF